jgi:dipeptidyl aminopeptidase/acylaminoacyl peptidase
MGVVVMDVDTRARDAAEAVRRSVEVDVEAGLRELGARRRRRRTEAALAAVAAVVLGVVVLEPVVGPRDDGQAPAAGEPVSTIFYGTGSGSAGVGVVDASEGAASRRGLDVDVEPADMAVSPDGSTLAVVDGNEGLRLLDLRTEDAASRYCSRCFEITWLSNAEVATRGLAPDGTVQTLRHDVSGGEPSWAFRVPEGTPLSGLSPEGDLAASDRAVGGADAYRLVITPGDGGTPVALVSTTTSPGESITDIAWSPDAARIGYVVRSPVRDRIGGDRYLLFTVLPDGSYPSKVADLGRCVCSQDHAPSFVWSPDGTEVAAVVGDSAGGRDRFRVVTLDMDEVAATAPSRRDQLLREVAPDGGSPLAWGLTPR